MSHQSVLSDSLKIRPSQLYVKDLEKVTAFYRDVVGLDSLQATESRVVLGHDQVPVLELVSKPEYPNAPDKSAGLFHNAIVFTSRAALAKAVLSVLQKTPWLYSGSADHLVSEAFYFQDPEGNGLELYFDRPRDSWRWTDGRVHMDTLYLDPRQYILENINGSDSTQDKEMGHVHLRVGDVAEARTFYVDQLGFDVTADMGSALFVSVGGYHHHLGMNTWMSQGAGRRSASLGLGEVNLLLSSTSNLDHLAGRLTDSKVPFQEKQGSLHVSDPWNNQLVFAAE